VIVIVIGVGVGDLDVVGDVRRRRKDVVVDGISESIQ